MKDRKISIAFQTDKTAVTYIGLARLVNRYDFDIVSVYCDAPYHPSFGPLLLMAPYLDRAVIGPAAISPFRMHPIDIAANTALLANLVDDRVYLGLARGAWLEDYGIQEPSKPILGIREAALIIRNLLGGDSAGYQGQIFRISDHVRAPYPLPNKKIPMMLGTWGPKLAAVAGEIADDVKVGGTANPGVAIKILDHIQLGNQRAGREKWETTLTVGAVTVVDSDRALARRIAKERLSLYLPVVVRLDPTVSLDDELIEQIQNSVNQRDYQTAGRLISNDVLEKFAFAGNPNDIIQQTEILFESGVNRVEFGTPHGVNSETGIKILGEKVIPGLRKI